MKRLLRVFTAVFMALLLAALLPAQVLADGPEYIRELKVGIGSASALEKDGYTVLKDNNGKPIDLNTDAGGGYGSEGDKEVYLGYKTTTDKREALTDLALMNMKGGYSVQEYEALMETQMKSQIIPFVESFLTTINEYRANYNSDIEANRERALYFHDMLNKLTDDDCGGKGLGDLLLKGVPPGVDIGKGVLAAAVARLGEILVHQRPVGELGSEKLDHRGVQPPFSSRYRVPAGWRPTILVGFVTL